MKKITFGLIVGTRNIFNAKLAREAREQLIAILDKAGFGSIILPSDATPTGAVETIADAKKCAKLFTDNRELIDGIIVVLPNFSDELGVVNTLKMSRLEVPVLIQACDDDNDKVDVYSRRDSFCGKLSVCNNLYQYGIKFTDTFYHTYSLTSPEFFKDLKYFGKVCRVVNGLKNARIGAVGSRPAAFQTMRASEKLLQASGITVVTVDLSELLGAAQKFGNQDSALVSRVKEIQEYGKIPSSVKPEKVVNQAKFGLALENWILENEINAAAVQCWESLQKNYGCAACLSMSMLGEKLIPCGCEVDIAGVVSMYALMLASEKPSALLDWNNNFGTDRNKVVCTHCSNYPKSFFQSEIQISTLDILGTVLGHDDTFGAIKGKVTAGDMTYFRVSTDDVNGKIKAYLGEGKITNDPYGMDGGIAVCEIQNLQQLMKHMCKNGFEHHVAMSRGLVAEAIQEAVDNYLGWDVYTHK